MNMRPGPSLYPRPDGQGCTPGTKVVPCSSGTNTGTCTPDINCVMGTNPGRTHRFFNGKAVIPFGYGLSYSSFGYHIVFASAAKHASLAPVHQLLAATTATKNTFPSMELSQARESAAVQYMVNVTNTGTVDADDVVLGFMTPPNAGIDGVALQTLFGFERVFVKAGETVTVNLYPELTAFTHVQSDGSRVAVAGEYRVRFGLHETEQLGMGFAEHSFIMA